MKKRNQLRIPVSVDVLGLEIPISLDAQYFIENEEVGDYGHTVDGPAIKLNPSKHVTQDELDSTLFHELLHVALRISGHTELLGKKTEEALVVGLENALVPAIRELVHAGHFRYPAKRKKQQ